MSDVILESANGPVVPVQAYAEDQVSAALETATDFVKGLAAAAEFRGKAGQVLAVPGASGATEAVWFGLGAAPGAMGFRTLAAKLPAGVYRIDRSPEGLDPAQIALPFPLGTYRFDRYK